MLSERITSTVQWWWVVPLGLAAAAVAGGVGWWWGRMRSTREPAVAHTMRLTSLPRYQYLARRHRRLLRAMVVTTGVLVIAVTMLAARPVRSQRATPTRESRDIMLCLDVSGSMVEYNRSVLEHFARLLGGFDGERVGMTIFNASAVTVFPLTTDYRFVTDQFAAFRDSFARRGIDTLAGTLEGNGSSLVPDGLASCALSFPEAEEGRSRSIVVATDNQVEGFPLVEMPTVVDLLDRRSIRVYAIFPLYSFEAADRPQAAEMRELAYDSGGGFYPLEGSGAAESIVGRIDQTQADVLDEESRLLRFAEPTLWVGVAAVAGSVTVVLAARLRR